MEIEEFIVGNKWNLLREISKKKQSPSELSEKTKTTIANISQQLKLMEAYGVVTKEKSSEPEVGKPKNIYSLKEDMLYVVLAKKGFADKKLMLNPQNFHAIIGKLFFLDNEEDHYYLTKFFFQNEEVIKKCNAVCFLKSTKENIELFILTEHVEEVRKKWSNVFVEGMDGKTKKIICWSHNEYEMNDGLAKGEHYFVNLMKHIVIFERDDALSRINEKKAK